MVNIGHLPTKGMNVAAFATELSCPFCRGAKWKFIEKVSEFRLRYQCKLCKRTVQYDISNRPTHPHEQEMKSNAFRELVRKINRSL